MADPLSILGAVSAAAGLADIGTRVFQSLYTFYQSVKDAPKQWAALCDELDMMVRILSRIPEIDAAPNSASLERAWVEVENLLKEMETAIKLAAPTGAPTGMIRLKWPFKDDENKKYLERISRYVHWLNVEFHIEELYPPVIKSLIFSENSRRLQTSIGQLGNALEERHNGNIEIVS